jgi:hypothetical protein
MTTLTPKSITADMSSQKMAPPLIDYSNCVCYYRAMSSAEIMRLPGRGIATKAAIVAAVAASALALSQACEPLKPAPVHNIGVELVDAAVVAAQPDPMQV